MSNIYKAFKNGKAFIPFITCGDPDIETTKRAVKALAAGGADMIELGIPFSDPTAEGPVIMEADMRALAGGITTDDIFAMVHELRTELTIPLCFMTYANVIFSYGADKFLKKSAEAGIDGIILPDVPFEERDEFLPECESNGIDLISLIAPTSDERIKMIASEAQGFLYIVSSLGVTGTRSSITTDLKRIMSEVRKYTEIPAAIGFGIYTPEQAREMSQTADGVIIGSAIVKLLQKHGKEAPEYIGEYARKIKNAITMQ